MKPHTRGGFVDYCMLYDAAENEFTFTCSVAGIDDFNHSLVLQQASDGRQLLSCTASKGLVLEHLGNDGKTIDRFVPVFEFRIVILWVFEPDQMADSPGDDEVIRNPSVVFRLLDAKDLGDVVCHTPLLGEDDDRHVGGSTGEAT